MKFFTKSINKSGALILTLLLCLFTGTAFGQEEITSFTGETLGTSDSKTEWTGHGVQWSNTYYKVLSMDQIVSPEIDFTAYTDVKVKANIRTFGGGNKKLSVYLGDTKLGEIAPANNKLNDVEISINPTEKGQLTFKGDNFDGNKGVGVHSITITGTASPKVKTVATPVFNPESGTTFKGNLNVKISTETEGAKIYYTLNGDEPTEQSTLYTEEGINLTATTTVKARAYANGFDPSSIVSAVYTLDESKTQATLAFEQKYYTVDFNGDLTLKVTSNNPDAKVTYTKNVDDNIALIDTDKDGNCYFTAGTTAKTVIVTATIPEDENYTSATATCQVRIIDPNVQYQDVSDVLTIDDFKNTTGQAYALTTDIVKTSGVVYAGSVQKGRSGGIGIRESKRDAGIYVTANPNGYRLKGVILEWADSQYATKRAVNIYGKNETYDSVQVLFDETRRGTLIKAIIGKPSEVSTAKTFEADYRFAGLVSDNGTPQFKSITFVWETAPVPTTGSFTIGEDKLATFYSQFAYTMPQGVTGGVVTYDNTKAGTITSVDVDYRYPAGSLVPAKTSLLLKGEPATYDYDITESELAAPTDNALHGANDVDDDNYTYVDLGSGVNVAYYTLSHDKETGKNVGFYFYEPDGAKTKYVAPHAYLALPYAAGTKAAPYLSLGNGDNGTTGINGNIADVKTVSRVYTITGACVGNSLKGLKKGIYIVNGKKVVL